MIKENKNIKKILKHVREHTKPGLCVVVNQSCSGMLSLSNMKPVQTAKSIWRTVFLSNNKGRMRERRQYERDDGE